MPEVINFYQTGDGLYLGKFVWFQTFIFLGPLDGTKHRNLNTSALLEKNNDLKQRMDWMMWRFLKTQKITLNKWLPTSETKVLNQKRTIKK